MKMVISVIAAVVLMGCSAEQNDSQKDTATPPVEKAVSPAPVSESSTHSVSLAVASSSVETPPLRERSGAEVFQKCASCHGMKAEKSALNKSQVIAGWSSEKIEAAIKGYKDGSYGAGMKALMAAQVASLSDEEITAVSRFIAAQ